MTGSPYVMRLATGTAQAEEPRSRDGCRGDGRSDRQGRPASSGRATTCSAGARAPSPSTRGHQEPVRPEAGQPHVRAGGRDRRLRVDGPPAPARRRPGPAGPEGPDQRRVRRRGHVRRADRQGVRCRGDRRVQHEEPRLVRSIGADHVIDYTRDDFTTGGPALRPHPRQRRQPLDGADPARADPDRDADLERRRARRRQARPHDPGHVRVDGRPPAGKPVRQDAEPRRPGRPQGLRRSRQGHARHRPHLPARPRPAEAIGHVADGARPRDGRHHASDRPPTSPDRPLHHHLRLPERNPIMSKATVTDSSSAA